MRCAIHGCRFEEESILLRSRLGELYSTPSRDARSDLTYLTRSPVPQAHYRPPQNPTKMNYYYRQMRPLATAAIVASAYRKLIRP